MKHRLVDKRTIIVAIVLAVVVSGVTVWRIRDSHTAQLASAAYMTPGQRAELTAKRKPFMDSCVYSASQAARGSLSEKAKQNYCACTLDQIIHKYYREHLEPIPSSDSVANLTDADTILTYADNDLTFADVKDIITACQSELKS